MDGEVFIFLHHKDLKNYYFEKIWFEEQKENLKKAKKNLPPKWAKLCLIEQWKNQLFEFIFLALKKLKNTLPPVAGL